MNEYIYSVIIPAYNAEKTIARCLDSLVSQFSGQEEIIVVDDGSKDATLQVAKEYAGRYPDIHVISKPNGGVSSARNAGILAAKGKYILFADSDDYVLEHYFDTLNTFEDSDLAVFAYESKKKENSIKVFPPKLLEAENRTAFFSEVIQSRSNSSCTKRLKREIIVKHGLLYPEDVTVGEDFVFVCRYMLCCRTMKAYDVALYCYDESSEDSIIRAVNYDLLQLIHMFDYGFEAMENSDWDETDKKQLMQVLDYQYCRSAFSGMMHLIEAKRTDLTPRELVRCFHDNLRQEIVPGGMLHQLMKRIVAGENVFLLSLTGKLALLKKRLS